MALPRPRSADTPLRQAPGSSSTRRSAWVWLLPIFLLLGQYGEYRHELTHYTKKATEPSKKATTTKADACALCLAYSHLSGAAKPEAVRAVLLSGLRFHHRREDTSASASVAPAQPRNRGPPTV